MFSPPVFTGCVCRKPWLDRCLSVATVRGMPLPKLPPALRAMRGLFPWHWEYLLFLHQNASRAIRVDIRVGPPQEHFRG